MKLSLATRIVLIGCMSAYAAVSQSWLSVGVKGGVPLTDPFADRTSSYVLFSIANEFFLLNESQLTRTYSGSRSFALGPTLEVQLPLGVAVEADALYRPLNAQIQQTLLVPYVVINQGTFSSRVITWEFPVLAKYRLPVPRVKPYVEAGPSFRAVGASAAEHMSGKGISAGVGVEARIGHLRIAPEVRYTHWGKDGNYTTQFHATSNPNQVEFLVGVSTAPGGSAGSSRANTGWTKHVSLGVKGGLPFTDAFLNDTYENTVAIPIGGCQYFNSTACSSGSPTVQTSRVSRGYLVGPMIEVHLPRNISIEANGLYSPMSLVSPNLGLAAFLLAVPLAQTTVHAWQFPVVGKYKFRMPLASPYVEAGPTFRTVSSSISPYLSEAGVTAGVGAEATTWKVHIAPEVRFVHWGNDASGTPPFYASRKNQAQFLVGLSY